MEVEELGRGGGRGGGGGWWRLVVEVVEVG